MSYGDLSIGISFDLKIDSAFSYRCGGCSRCCLGKAIRVGPYEILRLARHLNLSTTEFISHHTQSGGTVLRTTEQRNCGFLGPTGCSVHADRPLACRLYPLGMQVSPEGETRFGSLHPHPESEGTYGRDRTVADYLASQQTGPFLAANDAYERLYDFMVEALSKLHSSELAQRVERRAGIDEMEPGTLASAWMDIDGLLGTGPEHNDLQIETLVEKHILAIRKIVDELSLGADAPTSP